VQINRTGLRTVAVGTGDTSRLKLPYLPTSADVQVGDLLVTSGLGGGFPVGYPVGTVSRVRRDPAQSLAEVDVRPAAALDRSRELMFVWLKPGPVPTATTAAAAPPSAAAAAAPTTPAPVAAKPSAQKTAPAASAANQPKAAASTQAKAPANTQAKAPVKSVPASGASHP
jgi:rod shape-determining protein MreC